MEIKHLSFYINFELDTGISPYFDGNITPEKIIDTLEGYYHDRIVPEDTLIFLTRYKRAREFLRHSNILLKLHLSIM